MSTELKPLSNTGSRNIELSVTQYSGPAGQCFQFTGIMENGIYGYIQFNEKDLCFISELYKKIFKSEKYKKIFKSEKEEVSEYKILTDTDLITDEDEWKHNECWIKCTKSVGCYVKEWPILSFRRKINKKSETKSNRFNINLRDTESME